MRSILKIWVLAIGFSLPGIVFSLDMPIEGLEGYLPEEKEGKFKCGSYTLDSIGGSSERSNYLKYAFYSSRAAVLEFSIPQRKEIYIDIYNKINAELAANPEAKFVNRRGRVDAWHVSPELEDVLNAWARHLISEKADIERDICLLAWYESQLEEYSHIPSDFVNFYNALYDSYKELKGQCVKPETQGWTQDQEAADYVECLRRNARKNNELVIKIKDYRRVREDFGPVLERLDMDAQIRPVF